MSINKKSRCTSHLVRAFSFSDMAGKREYCAPTGSNEDRFHDNGDAMIDVDRKGETNMFTKVLVFLACIGGFLFGYDTGIISGSIVLITDDFELSDFEQEMVVSATVLGALISSLVSGSLCDHYGRRPVVLGSGILFIVGAITMALSPSFFVLITGRFIIGLGVGSASMNMPLIISEIAEKSVRGMLVTCVNVAITFGQFAACVVAGALSGVESGWRYMLGLAAVPAVIQFVGFLFMPESPRYLVAAGQVEAAKAVLRQVRGPGERDLQKEVNEIVSAVTEEKATAAGSGGKGWCQSVGARRALLLGCMLQVSQQMAGINTIMYYSATILKLAGFTSNTQVIWLSAVVAFFNFFGSCVGLRLVERVGRRRLMITSQTLVCVMLFGLSLSFYFAQITSTHLSTSIYDPVSEGGGGVNGKCGDYNYCFDCVQDEGCGFCSVTEGGGSFSDICIPNNDDNDSPTNSSLCASVNYDASECPGSTTVGWLIFVGLCLYLLVFAPGMGPMPWCINAEIYPPSLRSQGNAISTAFNWGSNMLMSGTFLTLINVLSKQGVFSVYGAVTAAFLCFFYKFLPETKNLPLESITYAFQDVNWGRTVNFRPLNDSDSSGREHSGDEIDSEDSCDDEHSHLSSRIERSAVSEALLKSQYFDDSLGGSAGNRDVSHGSSSLSGESIGLLAGEVSYSTQHDGMSKRESIVEF